MKRIAVLFLLLVLSLALSGCGGGEKSPAAAPENQPAAGKEQAPAAADNQYEKYLSAAEMEKAIGLTGLKAVENGTTLSFLDGSDQIVYEVRFYSTGFYEEEVGKNQKYYTDVPGVGDKAAICIPDSPYRLTFVKGESVLMTQTLTKDKDGNWLVSEEQLIALAKILAAKL
ncbi:MAG: hypothetical protein RBT41_08590 [Clostridia bacterium]|jgi:hypothetical protein|nr:hypothetical protein [Clostridia bacterium]